ncbi:hypothetical protein [Mycobacterium paraintracellulare]|uniref:hypothetical protein n=1 Tax=Mycobacterium paraintracellulare TaxID=1138383 RepID=UPI00191572E0|nr:hypothetical protein [Mycobacterium paraintracellulare]
MTDVKAKANAIRAELRRKADTIDSNPHLTAEGRQAAKARAYLECRNKMRPLRENFPSGNDDIRQRRVQGLFGLPAGSDASTTLAYRDGVERAANLRSPQELSNMLAKAVAMGDHLLARAVAGRAHELGVRSVVEAYAESAGVEDDYADLRDLPSNDLVSAAMFGLPMPDGLGGPFGRISDTELERIADGA